MLFKSSLGRQRIRPFSFTTLHGIANRSLHRAVTMRPLTLPQFSLENKVCVVTGGARGLGYTMAEAFLESGCTSLAIMDLLKEDAETAAEKLAASLVDAGQVKGRDIQVIGIGCDVSSEVAVQTAISEVLQKFGRIHTLVASAGIIENYPALDYPYERIKRLYDINVHGAFFCAREAARDMLQRKDGSIILIGSMSANIVNVPQLQTPYNASKAGKAVKHMGASLAVEWAKDGVRVNTLSPGYMLTDLTKNILNSNEELKRTWEDLTPMGHMGNPQDLKGAVVFLASDASKFVTGSELRVDGGYCVV